jgi:hypothetical protein
VIATTGWLVNTPIGTPQTIPQTAPLATAKGLVGNRKLPSRVRTTTTAAAGRTGSRFTSSMARTAVASSG